MTVMIGPGLKPEDSFKFIDEVIARHGTRSEGQANYHKRLPIAYVGMTSIIHDNHVLLLLRPKTATNAPNMWSVVCGYIDRKISLAAHAVLEVGQETKIAVSEADIIIGNPYLLKTDEEFRDAFIVPSRVELESRPKVKLNNEHTQARWVPFDRIPHYRRLSDLEYAIQAARGIVPELEPQSFEEALPLFDAATALRERKAGRELMMPQLL